MPAFPKKLATRVSLRIILRTMVKGGLSANEMSVPDKLCAVRLVGRSAQSPNNLAWNLFQFPNSIPRGSAPLFARCSCARH